MDRLTKSYSVFDCDAHINDPMGIWDHVPESKKELVRNTYWRGDGEAWLNGDTPVMGGGNAHFPGYNPICIAGPQMNKKIMRKLNAMPLTAEQKQYLHHDGAIDPAARLVEMDLMGIDQVLVIPTMVIMHVPFATNAEGVAAFCEAYNDFVVDWTSEESSRLFAAAFLPAQDAGYTVKEIERAAGLGLPVGLIRPIDAQAKYPNAAAPSMMANGAYDAVFKAFEDTGMVLGMHTFPAPNYAHPLGVDYLASPGELFNRAGVDSQTFSFVHEMQVWLSQVLLTGLLDRYPKLKMAVFESNAEWLPYTLKTCDRLYKLYARERGAHNSSDRLPSEAFHEQCVISFESDETGVFRQWQHFQKIGIWASDAYHHDGADSWSAMRNMTECGVPEDVQADLLGGNARRFYGIEGKLFVTDEAAPIDRPDWFPQGSELEEWADIVAHPRENAAKMREMGLDPMSLLSDDSPVAAGKGTY